MTGEGGLSMKDLADRIDQLEGKVAALTAVLMLKGLTDEDLKLANNHATSDDRIISPSILGVAEKTKRHAAEHITAMRAKLADLKP